MKKHYRAVLLTVGMFGEPVTSRDLILAIHGPDPSPIDRAECRFILHSLARMGLLENRYSVTERGFNCLNGRELR